MTAWVHEDDAIVIPSAFLGRFSMRFRWIGCGLLTSLSFAACGGSSSAAIPSDSDAGTDAAAIMQACAASAQARCARFDSCTAGYYTKLHYGDTATCEARLSANCMASLNAPDTGQSPAVTGACTSALPTAVCDDLLGDTPPAACAVPAGTRAMGVSCAFSAQCASSYCAIAKNSACGTCAKLPAAGDSCATTGECGARNGLSCNSVTLLCSTLGALNGACNTTTMPCAPGLYCVGSTSTVTGTCQTAVSTLGASCDPTHKTSAGCDPELGVFCSATSSTCIADPLQSAGQPCGIIDSVDDRCGAGGLCITTTPDGGTAATGTCAVAAPDGSACDTATGPTCLSPARCVVSGTGTAGTCATLDPTKCN